MDGRYARSARYWDEVFAGEEPVFPSQETTGCAGLDEGLDWLADGARSVLDFGCGNGVLLFLCHRRGTREHTGVDCSAEAIRGARARAALAPAGSYRFLRGGVSALDSLADASTDAVILSNILDNLWPDDARAVLAGVARVARPGAKALVKLNPYLEEEQVRAWGIRVIEGDLLDDGLPLWNRKTEDWLADLGRDFRLERRLEALWPGRERPERLLLLRRG